MIEECAAKICVPDSIDPAAILGEQTNAVKWTFHASNIYLLRNTFSDLPGIA